MKFAFYTLGCKVNQYETQAMQQMLCENGHTLGSFDEVCDGYIINTCTVTAVMAFAKAHVIGKGGYPLQQIFRDGKSPIWSAQVVVVGGAINP